MKRLLLINLRNWARNHPHKPIILRGARQVGKTHLIKQFGQEFKSFVSINFERQPEAISLFEKDLDPERLIRDLSLITGKKIIPGETLLFLDEVQEVPKAITALRYFYEECPKLHVIAAGSLLDFAIEKVGVPVGRVTFLHLFPMSFIEFLIALGHDIAVKQILEHPFPEPLTTSIHEQFLRYVAEYIAIGGMPEVVKCWRDTKDVDLCGQIQNDIITSYQQDFEKYANKFQIKYISLIFRHAQNQLASRFKFSKIPGEYRKRELAPAYYLLTMAGVIRPIYHSDGQGVPLGGQTDLDCFKTLFVDVALAQRILGRHPKDWFLYPKDTLINIGEMTECFVGQEILSYSDPQELPHLYYWQRHERGSSAEVDYLITVENKVIPIEVKSKLGTTLKSMHHFLRSHPNSPYGIRISTHPYSQHEQIHSYPLYAVAKLMLMNNSELSDSVSSAS